MKRIPFFKMSGSGNDFIVVNRTIFALDNLNLNDFVKETCRRRFSIGADGFIFIDESQKWDFKWMFFNADGNLTDMCGNGARCVARYAYINGIAGKNMVFGTKIGPIIAEVIGDIVKIGMPNPSNFKLSYNFKLGTQNLILHSVNTGVPHVVIFVNKINDIDVVRIGRNICHHNIFQPTCTNVNFVEVLSDNNLFIRTYERGVERETLACGTGSVAATLICSLQHSFKSPMKLVPRSGIKLKVYFERSGDRFKNIFLEGDARVIYSGELWEEGWKYI